MQLFYTVSSKPEDVQPKPSLSLGGYKSSSPLQSNLMGTMFGDISMYTVKNSYSNNYIALVLKNTTGVDVTNVMFSFTIPSTSYAAFNVAAVGMIADSDGNLAMEQVQTNMSKPISATFYSANGVANAVNIGSILAGGQIGLWVERVLDLPTIKTDQANLATPTVADPYIYEANVLGKEDDIDMVINWT